MKSITLRPNAIISSLTILLLGGLVWLLWPESSPRSAVHIAAHAAPSRVVVDRGSREVASPPEPAVSDRRTILDDLVLRWNQNAADSMGEDLLVKQRDLVREAVKLGGSDEFLNFLNFLTERGDGEVLSLAITEVASSIFAGSGAEPQR